MWHLTWESFEKQGAFTMRTEKFRREKTKPSRLQEVKERKEGHSKQA